MGASRYADWVEAYVRAWNSNDPEDIGSLFAESGRYYTEPYAEAWEGRAAIVSGWIEEKDEPGDTEFDYEVFIDTGELGIVKGNTVYKSTGHEYSNLWEIRLDSDGRCTEFVEWWMKKRKS